MAPIPGPADGVAPAAGAYRAGGARGQGEALASLISPQRRG